ncbi:hypothetical protein Tco_0510258, partial [Tanacetum coccineum]
LQTVLNALDSATRKHSDVGADSRILNYRGAHIHGNLNKASLNGAPLNSVI